MIPDAELQQMREDAERMQALRDKATPGPWKKTETTARGGHGSNALVSCEIHPVMEVFGFYDADNAANADLVIATRTDPSAANVLRLVGEVERLRESIKRVQSVACEHVDDPKSWNSFSEVSHFQSRDEYMRRAIAGDVIRSCYAYDVPVPEHLKPYEREGT